MSERGIKGSASTERKHVGFLEACRSVANRASFPSWLSRPASAERWLVMVTPLKVERISRLLTPSAAAAAAAYVSRAFRLSLHFGESTENSRLVSIQPRVGEFISRLPTPRRSFSRDVNGYTKMHRVSSVVNLFPRRILHKRLKSVLKELISP